MSVLIEFSMFPTDKGESASPYVSRIIRMMDQSGVPYQLTAMGTLFETENLDTALNLIRQAFAELEPDCNRVYMSLKMDYRKGKSERLVQKIKSIESKLGKEVRK